MTDIAELTETTEAAHCDTHGAFSRRVLHLFGGTAIRTDCPECKAQRVALEEARKRREEQAERARRVATLTEEAGVPLRFRDRTFDSFTAENPGQAFALRVCRKYAESFPEVRQRGTSIVMTGGPGTGKTHLACAIANAVIASDLVSVRFRTVSELMRRIKDTYRKDSPRTESDVIEAYTWLDLLIVDEIGVQVGSDHEKLLLFDILNGRYQNLRPTILLSNLSAGDLETYLGHRVMDRYRECGTVLAFDWQSYRGRA